MSAKKFFALLLACMLALGCLAMPAGAIEVPDADTELVMRATGNFESSVPANSISLVGNSFILNSGDIVSYDCSYAPRDANVKFGYIGPDGLFYGLSGYKGSINKGIRVNQHGTYTLAIWNKSDEAVSVWGTVNY